MIYYRVLWGLVFVDRTVLVQNICENKSHERFHDNIQVHVLGLDIPGTNIYQLNVRYGRTYSMCDPFGFIY